MTIRRLVHDIDDFCYKSLGELGNNEFLDYINNYTVEQLNCTKEELWKNRYELLRQARKQVEHLVGRWYTNKQLNQEAREMVEELIRKIPLYSVLLENLKSPEMVERYFQEINKTSDISLARESEKLKMSPTQKIRNKVFGDVMFVHPQLVQDENKEIHIGFTVDAIPKKCLPANWKQNIQDIITTESFSYFQDEEEFHIPKGSRISLIANSNREDIYYISEIEKETRYTKKMRIIDLYLSFAEKSGQEIMPSYVLNNNVEVVKYMENEIKKIFANTYVKSFGEFYQTLYLSDPTVFAEKAISSNDITEPVKMFIQNLSRSEMKDFMEYLKLETEDMRRKICDEMMKNPKKINPVYCLNEVLASDEKYKVIDVKLWNENKELNVFTKAIIGNNCSYNKFLDCLSNDSSKRRSILGGLKDGYIKNEIVKRLRDNSIEKDR